MPEGNTRLTDKVVLVTGATGGIGVDIVTRLASEGARVVVTDVNRSACDTAIQALEDSGSHLACALDITDEEQWAATLALVEERYGTLDAVVNNGAIGSLATVVDETVENYRTVVEVSQTGTWLGMKHAGAMIERTGGGSVVNICSILGSVGGLGNSIAYAAAKGAVRTMTKNAALHWARLGVRVNSIHPGFIATPPLLARYEGTPRHEAMLAGTPMGRLGSGAEVAAAVAFLAGDDARFMTGTELYVDGGWTAA
ncbi:MULTISPECIES: SDR family NAD(P)-dependent oxidoreductase [Nocardiaceae]|uniref:SDR family NAD(P)-dependent oxidoreductase n=1 Tax=Nocardiaceae TaxID=85025 RepID=UPI00195986AE|nr:MULTISPECIES: SDR family oxidoreductase [Rhodococcus]MBP1115847.1 NAD(P)-dependent dehydrogenase (short-subunit alcohol dehydrogenase family) [Rhodococcus sp. PvP016]